jgi:hypothetical protein
MDITIQPASIEHLSMTVRGYGDKVRLCRHKIQAADLGVVATSEGKLVGWIGLVEADHGTYYGAGSWVAKEARGIGLAFRMWKELVSLHEPASVEISAISKAGLGLCRKLEREFPGRFIIEDGTE